MVQERKNNGLFVLSIIIAVLAICFFVFKMPGFWAQLLAIIASAFLGASVTSLMTNSLLGREEAKDKNIKIHQSKVEVYSEFVREVWKQAAETDYWNVEKIRELVFNKLIFYLDRDELKELNDLFKKDKDVRQKDRIRLYSQITNIVRESIIGDNKKSDTKTKNNNKSANKTRKIDEEGCDADLLKDLWIAMSDSTDNKTRNAEETRQVVNLTEGLGNPNDNEDGMIPQIENPVQEYGFKQAWHFAMFGDEQLNALDKGVNELSLFEYGEDWRTNMLKQVEKDDIVFLFRRGGYGYVGAFRPLGWRVFDYKDGEKRETIHYFGQESIEKIGKEIDEDIKNYDIYDAIKDSADYCANLIVEPIAYIKDGVGTPGGVYRRTISRYYADYATALLQMFRESRLKANN